MTGRYRARIVNKQATVRKKTAAICALACLGSAGCQRNPNAEHKMPRGEADRPSPTRASSASIAAGKLFYDATDCAMCHGQPGDGKGVLVKDVKFNIHNCRNPVALKSFPDGELFYIITKGEGRMPG
jgi:hypothetical protein